MTKGGRTTDTLHLHFLDILKNALMGRQLSSFVELTPDQWEKMAQLAVQHKVLPLFYEAIRLLPELAGTEFLAHLGKQSRQQIILQTQKSYDFLKLYKSLREAGITPLVVKGIVCRSLYPQPDYRPSSDEDMLVMPSQFAACHDVLLQQGLQTGASYAQLETDYEIPYRSATSPLFIELHRSLFPPESEAYGYLNNYFLDIFDTAVQVEIDGICVATAAPTDHLFYLIVHALKHFLHSGFGIRQVCDICLYANAYGDQVNWIILMEQCRQIRAEYFVAAIFQIGEVYLRFNPQQAGYPQQWQMLQVAHEPLLQDILEGGVYGSASMSRQHSSNITLNAVAASKQDRKAGNALLGSLFPPASKLKNRYPWLEKNPWLLPVAWAGRILRYGKEIRHSSDNSAEEALKIGSERVALLKEYGIIR